MLCPVDAVTVVETAAAAMEAEAMQTVEAMALADEESVLQQQTNVSKLIAAGTCVFQCR